ncbi:hypothetical protein AB0F52_43520 [Amycolatopsis sp. NPDC024027]|uniref:hypothetical protein n=1 Tax=Amycolatopsis sp. NPDC024027 TaxID=3154327 RepID=UPI0033D3C324
MAATKTHPPSCAKATRPGCKCTNCGGTQHGWSNWVEIAREPEPVRTERRMRLIRMLTDWLAKHGEKPKAKVHPKEATVDLLRIDCAGGLARSAAGAAPDSAPIPRHDARTESGETSAGPPVAGDQPGSRAPAGEPDGSASEAEVARVPHEVEPDRPDAVEQVDAFAQAMTKDIWQDVVGELQGSPEEIKAIRLQFAHHCWCDLFIGFVQALEAFGKVVEKAPDKAKEIITEAICGSSKQKKRSKLTEQVVDMVVDKAWSAFKAAAIAHSPLFGLLSGEELLRNLRIIAIFICPAPNNHKEVQEHAIDPLLRDARAYISDETKQWLATRFKQWADGVARPAVPGSREGEGRSELGPPKRPPHD